MKFRGKQKASSVLPLFLPGLGLGKGLEEGHGFPAPLGRPAASLKPLRAPLTQPPPFSYELGYPAPSSIQAHFLGEKPTSTASNVAQVTHVLLELGPTALESDEDKLHKVENLVCLFPPLSPGIPHAAWLIEETDVDLPSGYTEGPDGLRGGLTAQAPESRVVGSSCALPVPAQTDVHLLQVLWGQAEAARGTSTVSMEEPRRPQGTFHGGALPWKRPL